MSKNIELKILYDIDFIADDIIPHVVEEGSDIELSCEIDEYPEDLEIIWKKINPSHWSNKEVKLVMGPSILIGHGRMRVTIEKEGHPKVSLESIFGCQQFLITNDFLNIILWAGTFMKNKRYEVIRIKMKVSFISTQL